SLPASRPMRRIFSPAACNASAATFPVLPLAPVMTIMCASLRNWLCALLRIHRNLHARFFCECGCFGIPGIHVTGNPDARVVGEDTLDARSHLGRAVSHGHLAGVQGIADAYTASIVNRNPARSAGGIEQGIEQRPIGHGIRTVEHFFCFAEG